jgi:hypothetical protein
MGKRKTIMLHVPVMGTGAELIVKVINFYLVQKILEIDNKHQYSNKNHTVVVIFKCLNSGNNKMLPLASYSYFRDILK